MTDLEQLLRDTNPDHLNWDTQRIWRAMVLAPTVQVFEALLKGDNVPVSQLDPVWVKRLGVK